MNRHGASGLLLQTSPPFAFEYRPGLDAVRGIAILLVLAAHAGLPGFAPEGGLAGVTLFFVLSGFLITSLLLVELGRAGSVRMSAFYWRRALRLLPALAAVLVVVSVGYGVGAWPNSTVNLPGAVGATALYVANWAQIAGVPFGVLGHTWSLAIEEQFYLVWPWLLVLAVRRWGAREAGLVVTGLAVLVVPWRMWLLMDGQAGRVFAGTDTHADALLLGCAIALGRLRLPPVAGWVGIGGVVLSSMAWLDGGAGLAVWLPIATVCSCLAVAAPPTALSWRPLIAIGRISYGLYLWHFLYTASTLSAPVVLVLSFATAMASYRWIETPFLRLRSRHRVVAMPSPDVEVAPPSRW